MPNEPDRAKISVVAHRSLGDAPANVRLHPLIAAVTLDPTANPGIGTVLADMSGRLQ